MLALGPALAAEDAVAAGEPDGARPRVADNARLRVEADPARHHLHQLLDERNSMNPVIDDDDHDHFHQLRHDLRSDEPINRTPN